MVEGNEMATESPNPVGQSGHGDAGSRPPSSEETLKSGSIQIERKVFTLALKQNARGRFLRITEDVNGRRDTVIIPASGLTDFRRILDEMAESNTADPCK